MKKLISTVLVCVIALSAHGSAMASEVLKLGSKGGEVFSVHDSLRRNGLDINDEYGSFGLSTLGALIKFQDREDLYISGVVDEETRKILFEETTDISYSEEDLYWLSRIVHAESGGESYMGKLAVANCVINRVRSKDYPDNIKDVIFDTKYGVQYQPAANGTIYNTPGNESIRAAKAALSGENIVGECLFFFNPKTATNFWISENRTFYTAIGNHHFYL